MWDGHNVMTVRDFSIGELSKRTDVNIETIRYYEKIGCNRRSNNPSLKRLICSVAPE
jgi:hypothetical protein